jgi:L-alanine-DL-glutamate epimerase-like enolase superfamily enzyme
MRDGGRRADTIAEVRIGRRRLPLREAFTTSRGTAAEVVAVTLALAMADGTTGVAAATPATRLTGETLGSIEDALAGPLRDALFATPVEEHAVLLRNVRDALPGNHAAKAAVDVALHDLRAQRLGTTLPRLLGTGRPQVRTDVTVSSDTPEEMTVAATRRLESGFDTLKLKVGAADAATDVERITAVFRAAGGRAALRLDANQGWSRNVAAEVLAQLAAGGVKVEFVEQPVAAWDLDGMRWLRERCPFPVMADESVAGAVDVRRVADAGAADMVNLKVLKCGGLAAVRDAAAVAEAVGLPCMLGSMLEMPGMLAASVALASTLPWVGAHDLDAGWWLDPASATRGWPRYEPPLVFGDVERSLHRGVT